MSTSVRLYANQQPQLLYAVLTFCRLCTSRRGCHGQLWRRSTVPDADCPDAVVVVVLASAAVVAADDGTEHAVAAAVVMRAVLLVILMKYHFDNLSQFAELAAAACQRQIHIRCTHSSLQQEHLDLRTALNVIHVIQHSLSLSPSSVPGTARQ